MATSSEREGMERMKVINHSRKQFELLDTLIAQAQTIKESFNEGGSWDGVRDDLEDMATDINDWYMRMHTARR